MKKHITIVIILVIFVSCFVGCSGSGNLDYISAGETFSKLDSQDSKVLANVNSIEITENDVLLKINIDDLNKKQQLSSIETAKEQKLISEDEYEKFRDEIEKTDVDESTVLEELVQNAVMYTEAKKLGLDVSAEYARDVLQKSIDATEDAVEQENGSDPNNELVLENQAAFIQGTGYSEEEYYENAVPAIQETIAINRLREDFVSGLAAEDKNDTAKVEEKYSAYVKKLVEDADIEYF